MGWGLGLGLGVAVGWGVGVGEAVGWGVGVGEAGGGTVTTGMDSTMCIGTMSKLGFRIRRLEIQNMYYTTKILTC